MQFTRSRRFGRHTQRDFDQERADLIEGYQSQKNFYESIINKELDSNEYPREQKQERLQCLKDEVLRLDANYSTNMQRLNAEEAQYRAEEGYEGSYASGGQDTADSFCTFADHSGYDDSSDAMNYCGSVDFADSTEETYENDQSNGM